MRSRHCADVNANTAPDRSRESRTSTDDPRQDTSTHAPWSALARLVRHAVEERGSPWPVIRWPPPVPGHKYAN